jgi:uncharacterized protein (DUF1786 family)
VRALAVDVGTGTQDILLFDSDREIENAFRLVLPSPTVIVAGLIREATRRRQAIVLTGSTMGGGPSAWAARDHLLAGFPLAATPGAARTFDDDLESVQAMGVRLIEPGDAQGLARRSDGLVIELRDLDVPGIAAAFGGFGVGLTRVDALAVAVFDHGAAPPGISDRRFRFDRLRERLAAEPSAGTAAFAYRERSIPDAFTRLAAAARSARGWLDTQGGHSDRVVAMDTAPAAVLGALDDGDVRTALAAGRSIVAVNVGNFHTLAMRLDPEGRVGALMEHHTGELRRRDLARLVRQTADGSISDAEVFASMGHGALVVDGWTGGSRPAGRPFLCVTGPRRALLGERVVRGVGRAHYAVPHGDMMQAGTFGLLRALAHLREEWREPVARRLGRPAG